MSRQNETAAPTAIGNGGEEGKLGGYSDCDISMSPAFPSISNEPDVAGILIDARREIAIATLTELDFQSYRLGDLVHEGLLDIATAADTLYEAALANKLVQIHGVDQVQAIMAAGLAAR